MEHIAEVAEENEGALANISMSSKTSQESAMESAAETHRLRNVQSCVSTHLNISELQGFQNSKISSQKFVKTFQTCYKFDCIF